MTTRRQFLVAGALCALITRYPAAEERAARVGILGPLARDKSLLTPLLLQALSELGYREGAAMAVDYRFTETHKDYPRVVRELTGAKCDIIFALGSDAAARAVRDARSPVPGVFIAVQFDPLETGLVESLARPGGNITGVYIPISALAAKRIDIAREVLPGASRFLVFADKESRGQLEGIKKAAQTRGAQLTVAEYTSPPYDLAAGFEAGRAAGAKAILALTSPGFARSRTEFSELLLQHRLPAFVPGYMADLPGILVAYSIDSAKLARRAAEMGVRILKGAKPGGMPIEQLDEYDVTVNLKTARAIGIKIPYSLMMRASKVIE